MGKTAMGPPELPQVPCEPGTLVIGDLHLDVFEGSGPRSFGAWLERLLPLSVPRLVILGDLFEYWVGRGQGAEPGAGAILDGLRRLVLAGTEVDLLHGNRDFLLCSEVEGATGARVRPHGLIGLMEGGRRTVFLHGDELCTGDRGYQRFRHVVRSGLVRGVVRITPLGLRRRAALALRRRSGQSTAAKAPDVVEMKASEALAWAERTSARTVICGHAHSFRDEALNGEARWLVIDGWGGRRDLLRLGPGGIWAPGSSREAIQGLPCD